MSRSAKVITMIVVAVVALGGGLVLGWYLKDYSKDSQNYQQTNNISSFEECIEAGYPAQESQPRRCAVPGGETFTEELESEITYHNTNGEEIKITSPQPGETVEREFEVTGQAIGPWFFEASFTVEVISPSGDRVAQNIVTAEGDWMQAGLVDFKSEIVQLPSAYNGDATLVLRKNNPSGLEENDASISIPIVVE